MAEKDQSKLGIELNLDEETAAKIIGLDAKYTTVIQVLVSDVVTRISFGESIKEMARFHSAVVIPTSSVHQITELINEAVTEHYEKKKKKEKKPSDG